MTSSTRIRDALYPGASLIGEEEVEAVARVARSADLFRYYGRGEPRETRAYEREWAARIGVRHALAVNSGTSALFCALVAAGVEPGDEVILPAFSWVSVPNAVLQVGGIPVVVDVDEGLTLDPRAVEAHLGPRTRAILPVHMRGAPSDLEGLLAVANRAGVALVEDACQAAGVTYRDRPVGSFGHVAAMSTQYAKVVVTGEGGVVFTDDDDAHRAALDAHDPANASRRGEPPSSYPGLNLRCTELQAAVGRVQLSRLDALVERTRAHAARIAATVAAVPELRLRLPHDPDGGNGVAVIFFAPSSTDARRLRDDLRDAGVPVHVLFEPDVVDLHVSAWWRSVDAALERHGRDARDCRASLELLARSVQIDVHPLYDDGDVDGICGAVAAATAAVCGSS